MPPTDPPPARPAPSAPSLAAILRRRLQEGVLRVLTLTGLLLVAGLLAFLWTDRAYSRILADTTTSEGLIIDLNGAALTEVLHTRAYLITGDTQSRTSRALAAQDFDRAFSALRDRMAQLPPEAVQALEELEALHNDYEHLADEMIALESAGDDQATVVLFNDRSDPLVLRLLDTRQTLRAAMQAAVLEASQQYSQRTALVIALVIAGLGICLVGGTGWIQRQVAEPLAALDYLERALLDTVPPGPTPPTRLPQSLVAEGYPLLAAYNFLVDRLVEGATARLEFAARLAHDCRSPLATISGYAALLEAQPPGVADAASKAYLQVIGSQTQHMLRLLDRMVMTARLEEGKIRLLRAPLRLGSFLKLLVDELAADHQRNISLDDPVLTQVVEADASLLRELFVILIENAAKYSPAETDIWVQVRPASRPGWVDIQVVDQGTGIEAGALLTLFRPFARVYNPSAHGPSGSGLGLYIARHIAERHGGTVELVSRLGAGTTACVSLPLLSTV